MNNHTPLPWIRTNGTDIFSSLGAKNSSGILPSSNMDGWQIADCSQGICFIGDTKVELTKEEQLSNAKFIVRACNSHYELLEACKTLIKWLEDSNLTKTMDYPWSKGVEYSMITEAKQAIKKAEGN